MKEIPLFLVVWGMFILVGVMPNCNTAVAESNPFSVSGYGVIHYANFDWDFEPKRPSAIDVERLVVAPKYHINDTIRLEAELEFEHGGTGSTMEFDKFEEFGEFELEVEKGGEIIVEKLCRRFLNSIRIQSSHRTYYCSSRTCCKTASTATLLYHNPS